MCHVTLRLMCEPAKYSAPGTPNFFGEQVNVCHVKWLMPSANASSAIGLRNAGSTLQWRIMWVNPSTEMRGRP